MRTIAFSITALFCLKICTGQQGKVRSELVSKKCFVGLIDSTIQKEMAFFTHKASFTVEKDSFPKIKLNEVSLKKCSDKSAYFEKGNIYTSEIIVSIHAEEKEGRARIKEILYVHYKLGLTLPDSAFVDICDPVFCRKYTKKGKPVLTDCKVFQSIDKRRIYIYMLNGEGAGRYEVIWIIQDDKYRARVVNRVKSS